MRSLLYGVQWVNFKPPTPCGVGPTGVPAWLLFKFISIHAPREGCDCVTHGHFYATGISIHAPREGCDWRTWKSVYMRLRFQSTHPVRGATEKNNITGRRSKISIHAPREGCDNPDSRF